MQVSRLIKKTLNSFFNGDFLKKKSEPLKLNRKKIIFDESETPTVTVIIPFYNQEKFTWNCLTHLNQNLTSKYPYEIILIDDNSSEKYDFSLIQGIKIIKNETNLGFLKNINKGIKASKGEYIYILNNDTAVEKNFLDELFYVFENYNDVGAVGSKLLNIDGTLQEVGSVLLKDFGIRQVVKNKRQNDPEVNYIYQVDYCSGCSLLFKKFKDDKITLNLLDERFAPAYFEETDFCFDLKHNQNKKIYYTPFSKVLHYNGVSYNGKTNSTKESLERKELLFKINKEKFWNKWQTQIESIKSKKTEERIIEKYHKSIAFIVNKIPEPDKESGTNRLNETIKSFINFNIHVTLIITDIDSKKQNIEYYQRMGVNVYNNKKTVDYLTKTNPNVNLIWFYGSDSFKENYSKFKKTFINKVFIYEIEEIYHLKYLKAISFDTDSTHQLNYKKYKEVETVFVKNANFVVTRSEKEKELMKTYFDNIILIDENKLLKAEIKNFLQTISNIIH